MNARPLTVHLTSRFNQISEVGGWRDKALIAWCAYYTDILSDTSKQVRVPIIFICISYTDNYSKQAPTFQLM